MNAQECVQVIAYIAARCPAMRLEDATPTAWFEDLERFEFEDCREAAKAVSSRQAFVGLHDLLTETAVIERRRLGKARAAELAAALEAEGVTAIDAAPPAEPNTDWRDLEDHLTKRSLTQAGQTRPMRDPYRMAQARAELDAARKDTA